MNLCVESSVCYDFAQEVSFLIKNHNSVMLGGAKDQWENPKVRNLMGALWIPISLDLGYSEQFSESL